jgi:hypothetical protein
MTDIIKTDSRFLHGEDLQREGKWQEFTLTIKDVQEKDSMKSEEGQKIDGWPISFEETPKILVLNTTNTRLAICAIGTNLRSEWPGKKLTVYPVIGSWFGQRDVYALRVRVPAGTPRPFIQPSVLGRDLTKKGK